MIVLRDTRQIREQMDTLGATAVVKDGYTAYVWNSRLGDLFLIGTGVVDGSLLMGPRRLHAMPMGLGAGAYTIIELLHDRAVVQPDPFGMSPIYYSHGLVTNRLHLAGSIVRGVDTANAMSTTYNDGGFSFSFNTFKTPVQDIELLPAGARVEVSSGRLNVVEQETDQNFLTISPDEYWALIEAGAREVMENVVGVVDSGLPVFADITGGRDSRVVFGALLAAGSATSSSTRSRIRRIRRSRPIWRSGVASSPCTEVPTRSVRGSWVMRRIASSRTCSVGEARFSGRTTGSLPRTSARLRP